MNPRIHELRETLKEKRLRGLLIDNLVQSQYALEMYKTIPPGEARCLTVVEREAVTLIADPLSLHRLHDVLPETVHVVEADGNAFVRKRYRFARELARVLKRGKVTRVGAFSTRYKDVLPDGISLRVLEENPLLDLAETRTRYELELLERAVAIADKVYEQAVAALKVGRSELWLKCYIDERLYAEGADLPAFGTLVSFGENTNQIHAVSTTRRLKDGDLVMVDFGAKVKGIGSDLTRTIAFGKPTASLAHLWRAVRDAQKVALEAIKPGVQGATIAVKARKHLVRSGYGDFYCHSLGHQLGLLNGPTGLSMGCKQKLRPGMVLTVEPGAYIPEGGARIEDDVMVTAEGCRVLTKAPKRMVV